MNYIVYKIVKFILNPLFKLVFRPSIIGLNNIPKSGAVILAGNHTNNLDAAIMLSGPKRIVHMMAKKELFNTKLKNFFFRSMGCISVNRSIHDENAKSEAINVLNNGEVLGIFPEGTVNKTGRDLLPFKYGAVSFAKKTGALIVPFSITGKYKAFRKSIRIIYGKPYKVDKDLELENEILTKKVLELKKKGEKYDREKNKKISLA